METDETFEVRQSLLDLATFEKLAERVGVEPLAEGAKPWIAIELPDGRRFDPFAVFNAMLDRLETTG